LIILPGEAKLVSQLLNLFATSSDAPGPRRQKLITAVLHDFRRLSGEPPDAATEKS
jgi:hypothetical protein